MSRLLTCLLALFPARFRRQFADDMAEHIRMESRRARARGRAAAIRNGVAQALDLVRSAVAEHLRPSWSPSSHTPEDPSSAESWGTSRLGDLRTDLRWAWRSLRRSPGFVAVTVATLGLAIGINAGLFTIVDTVLFEALPYRDADRLVTIAASAPGTDLPEEFGVSAEFYVHYRERSELLDDVAIYSRFTHTLRANDLTERVWMSATSTSLLQLLGARPVLGRLPNEEDEDRVAVISHALWTSWFGSDPDVVGRTIHAAGDQRTVIGVLGPDFWFPDDRVLLWMPNVTRPERINPGRFGLSLAGRLAPGATREALAEELDRLARELPDRFGGSPRYAEVINAHRAIVRPLEEDLIGALRRPLWILLASVAIVLLIACANVANLFQVRTERRQHDLAVQRAVGAARGRLIRSQLTEALVLAALGGALAMLLAWATVPLLVRAIPAAVPRLGQAEIGWPTVLFAGVASLVAALSFGLLPSIRGSAASLTRLRDGGRGATRRRRWGSSSLVAAQTALGLVLLIGSALLLRSFDRLRAVDPGYDIDDVFTFQIAPEGADLTDGPSYARFHLDFMERLRSLPGVESVGLVENVPLNEGLAGAPFLTDGAEREAGAELRASYTWTAGDYFEAMGIGLLRGRIFEEDEQRDVLRRVIVSETAAELFWPGENPIGRRLRRSDLEGWDTVVGVVEDVMQFSFRDEPLAIVYFPMVGPSLGGGELSTPAFVLKTPRAEEIAPEVRELVREVAPGAPMYRVFTMAQLAADSMIRLSFTLVTLAVVSALALILGAIGLFGVLSQLVAERTQEIGVRMALGAAPARVRRMVVLQGIRVVGVGIVIGVLAATAVTRVFDSLLYRVDALDVPTFAWMSLAMAVLGLLATWLPARRASAVDPLRSLRES